MFVLYDVCVYATVLDLSGQLSGGFDLGHNSPGQSGSSYQCKHGAWVV